MCGSEQSGLSEKPILWAFFDGKPKKRKKIEKNEKKLEKVIDNMAPLVLYSISLPAR